MWQSEWIFWARLIEIRVINTHASPSILLLHQDWVCQPIGMVDFFDEVGSCELGELISDGLFSVLRESMESLLDRFSSFLHIEGVLNHLPGDTRHVGGFPSKDVLVCPKDGDECAFLFGIELCPDQGHLGRIGRVKLDLLELLIGADSRLGCFLGWNVSLLLKGACGKPDAILLSLCLQVFCQSAALLVAVV